MCRKTLKQNTRSFKRNEDLDDKMAKFEEISQKEKKVAIATILKL